MGITGHRRDLPLDLIKCSDASFQSVLDAAPDAMLVINQAWEIVVANTQAEKLFGYNREQLIGKSVESLISPRFRDRHLHDRENFFGDARVQPIGTWLELFALRRDGTEIPVEINLSPLTTESGTFVISAIRDATELRLAPVLIWMSGTDKLRTYFNKPWLDFTGRTLDEEKGNGWAEGVHPEDLRRCLDTYTEAFDQREEFRMEYRLRRHDGEYRWIFDSGVPRFNQDGSFAGYIGSALDVTERKRVDKAVSKSEERFRSAAKVGKMFAYEWDIATDLVMRSGEGAQILGIDDATPITGQQLLAKVHPDDRERVTAAIAELSPENAYLQISYRRVRPDGTVIWVERNGRAHFDEQGRMVRMVGMTADITERKRAEEELRQKERELSEAQRLAQIGSWEWDPDNDTVNWSRELYRITGRDPNLPAASYKEHPQILTAESWERLKRNVEEALHSGTPYDLDLEYVRPDGSTIWARARGEAKRDTAGRIVGLRGTAQDITERRLAERELALANDRLRLAMDASKSVGWDWNIKSGLDSWFGDLPSMFGIASETYFGSVEELHRYMHPEDRERVGKAVKDAMESRKPYAAEYRILRPDGAVRWVAAKGKFYYSPDGEAERMLGMKVDITERKLAEEALRESEERLRLAVQVGKMYAFDWDVATDAIIRSEEAARILGLAGEPIRLTKQQLLASVHPEDRATFINSIAERTPESPDTQITYRLLRPDGSILWLERTGHAFFDEQGRMVRMIGMVTDVTERKLAEEALARVGGRLIEAHEEERTRIARELHDDISQQLALLANNLTLMEQDLPDSAAEIRHRIHEQSKHVHEIAGDVQAMSHRLHSSKLRLLGIVFAAKGFCQEISEQHKVEIDFTHVDIPPAVPEEISLCLFRIMQEALQNAVKYSGVRHFDVELRGESNGIHLTVRDAGLGFDPEAAMNNRGLGLVSMQERVNLVKGMFSIDSRPGRGTTIHVRLPLSTRRESAKAAAE